MNHLARRIENYHPDGDPSHDRAEHAALKWAIPILERHVEEQREERQR